MKIFSKKLILTITIVLLILIIGYFFSKNKNMTDDGGTAVGDDVNWVEEIGKIIVLPTGETPSVGTVSDVDKLKGQPFFVDAKTGDKVLIYNTAKKVILYDPVLKKIVNVAPFTLSTAPTLKK